MGLKWSINGKDFKFFGIRVADSKGLIDKLKPRERQSYTWAEYHGKQIDLSSPRYEARDMVLSCWIVADNVEVLTKQYNSFMNEFDKSGTQRFMIEPFDKAPYIYDVVLSDKSELDKEFNDGQMFGTFNIVLQEPNPIKKVLYTVNPQLTLSYNSLTETDIIIDGVRYQGKEVVNFTKNLNPRVIFSDNYGRNLFMGKLFLDSSDIPNASIREQGQIKVLTNTIFNAYAFVNHTLNATVGDKYAISMDIRFNQVFTSLKVRVFSEYPNNTVGIEINNMQPNIWHRVSIVSNQVVDPTKRMLVVVEGTAQSGAIVDYRDFKVEIGGLSTPYSVAPEEQHFISIAGNIEDIKNFTTNAEVLWEKI
ncbi:hypothetical protein [Chryseobacterium bernardetii]|uniref:hypothetical protein n=1 Tax=Chryseobacterium bernardetii TaxID=1241978 RepID=UPI0016285B30|nr:hypothetical protein [Chryseobacterium bernardetii]